MEVPKRLREGGASGDGQPSGLADAAERTPDLGGAGIDAAWAADIEEID